MKYIILLLIPLLGTSLGCAIVFLIDKDLNNKTKKMLLGFSSGIMLAASIFSLLIPSMEYSKMQGINEWLPASVGFFVGIVILLILDVLLLPKIVKKHKDTQKNILMILAVTLHNIPEGIAIGVSLASVLVLNYYNTLSQALLLTFGIAIQNIPEGSVVSTPLISNGMNRKKAFLIGLITGIVEPISAFLTIMLTNLTVPFLPYLLAFASGAMMYVVTVEIIPEAQSGKNSYIATLSLTMGFLLMIILNIILG